MEKPFLLAAQAIALHKTVPRAQGCDGSKD